jgi:hypothetical protein
MVIQLVKNTRLVLPQEELKSGEEIARCPSCSLYITVIYDPVSSCEQIMP